MKRKTELSRLNIWFCMMVVLIHVLSSPVSSLSRTSWQYAVVYIVQRLCFVAVPGFFLLSGLKFTLGSDENFSLKKYYLKRLKTVLLPYLIAVTVYVLYFVWLGWIDTSFRSILEYYCLGNIAAHFYYVVGLVQFIILAPLWRLIVRKVPAAVALPVSLCISVLSTVYLGYWFPSFIYSDRIFISYLFYYLAGCYIGKDYDGFMARLKKNSALFCTIAAVFTLATAIGGLLMSSGRAIVLGTGEVLMMYEATAFFPLMLLAAKLNDRPLLPLENTIDKGSYLIYLYHIFFIQIFEYQLRPAVQDAGVRLLLRLIFVYAATIIAVSLWQKLTGKK